MRRLAWLWVVILVLGLAACNGGTETIYGALSGTVTYAKSADQPLTDPANIGEPATDVIVRISLLEQSKYSGGQPIFVQGDALFELGLDDKGGYNAQLPQGQYMLEVIGKEGKVLAKQMIKMKPGQPLRADFNVAK